ncbi:MAG TPA: ATP-binding protein [Candidatus Aquicultor sp.]|jgi:two-component system phosphate regulon sensor histidine kinase PhoR
MRINNKLVISYTLLTALCLFIISAIIRFEVQSSYTQTFKNQLISEANTVKVAVDSLSAGRFASDQTNDLVQKLSRQMNARITLITRNGVVVADTEANPKTMGNHAKRPEVQQALRGNTGISERYSSTVGHTMLYVAIPYTNAEKGNGVIRIALPLSDIAAAINKLSMIMAAIAFLATLVIIAVSTILARSFTRPLRQMMNMASSMADDDFEQQLSINTRDELGELSQSLNNLAMKLKDRINELRTEKAKAEHILHNMAEGIVLINKDGVIVLTNPAAERVLRFTQENVIGAPLARVIDNHEIETAITEALLSRREVNEEVELSVPFIKLRLRALPVTGISGDHQVLTVIKDITREKHVERLRKDFVANVSHELKTPLTGLKLLAETLCQSIETDPVASKRFAERLDKELSTLINMVRELIDLSRLERSDEAITASPVDLRELVREVGSSFSELAVDKGLTLEFDIPQKLTPVIGDKDQLLTLVRNLVDNAIRYTLSGGTIKVMLSQDNDRVRFLVADDGIGLAQREIPRIFERFYRVDKARSRETGGTGLGLSIVKHIAENHNATINVESTLGIGSTFTVGFPIQPA